MPTHAPSVGDVVDSHHNCALADILLNQLIAFNEIFKSSLSYKGNYYISICDKVTKSLMLNLIQIEFVTV